MITKEELLQKGIDPAEADKIISALEGQAENSSPLEALNKALKDDSEMDSLFKAAKKGEGDEDEDEDEEEYDEKFMKKMKKYMKSKGKYDGKDEEPDDDSDDKGFFGKDMKKAVDNIDPNSDGFVIEMADFKPVFDSMVSTMQKMSKAISGLERRIEVLSDQNSDSYSLLAKAAAVTAETAEIVNGIGNIPTGRKGALMADMQKAKQAENVDPQKVWSVLAKAVNAGDIKAGEIGSKFESAGKRFNFLSDPEQAYVRDLMKKEAN